MKKVLIVLLAILLLSTLISCEQNDTSTKNSNNKQYEEKGDYYYSNEKQTERYYTVMFQTNGGSQIQSKQIKDGGQINTAPVTTKNGHLFEGWFLDETFTTAAIFPLSINNDTIIYAKWLTLENTRSFTSSSIKMWKDSSDAIYYSISPSGFDMERLSTLGYSMTITVSYTVRYEKDYDALWDIGYAGSPKYEVCIVNSEDIGQFQKDLSTSKTATERTITYKQTVSTIKNETLKLKFSTDNIQNTIYFENIIVTYTCS